MVNLGRGKGGALEKSVIDVYKDKNVDHVDDGVDEDIFHQRGKGRQNLSSDAFIVYCNAAAVPMY